MKLLALAITFLFGTAFAGVSNVDVRKSSDGKTLNCTAKINIGNAGYRLSDISLQSTGGDILFSTKITGLICVPTRNGAGFDNRPIGSPITRGDSRSAPTVETFRDLNFLMTNIHSDVLMKKEAANEVVQTLENTFPVRESFTQEELNQLDHGQTLHVRWQFFLQGLHSVQQEGETIPLGLFTGGSYYLNFDLRQENGLFKIENFYLN